MSQSAALEGLNPPQLDAVKSTQGPLLILAGAGSGKTKVLTHRIAHLIEDQKVSPFNILAVTFTNKAAKEMRQRIASLLMQSADQRGFMPYMGTFHSIGVRILRQDGDHIGVPKNFVIFDELDRANAVKEVLKSQGVNEKQYSAKIVAAIISGSKNELITPEQYAPLAKTPVQKVAAKAWPAYENQLKDAGALDFDDLIGKTVNLLSVKEIGDKWRKQFQYVLIDEYQDTNSAQYKLVKLLVNDQHNICVVGDDWQSIYSWRGADYRNILNFEKDYPNSKTVKLEQNYRSTKAILGAAHLVMSPNKTKSSKNLWTDRKDGVPINIQQVTDENAEAEFIVKMIKHKIANKNRQLSDFVVLYRTNAQSRSLEEMFIRYGVPYRLIGGHRFYDRKEIKDVIAYLRFIYQSQDLISLLRIINVPTRGIGAKTINDFLIWRDSNNLGLWQALQSYGSSSEGAGRGGQAINRFSEMIARLRDFAEEAKVAELVDVVVKRTNYIDFLDDGSLKAQERVENVRELVSVAKEYQDHGLAGFLEEVALITDLEQVDSSVSAVSLMTMHSAKGLEFPVVYMTGLEESLFPHSRALFDQTEMEEERRLCYVGMTRAMDELHLLYANRRMLFGNIQHNPPSRFLSDMDSQYHESTNQTIADTSLSIDQMRRETVDIKTGDKVSHKVFGSGKVVSIDEDVATIDFDQRGEKKLNIAFAPLEKH